MPELIPAREGYASFRRYRTWFRVVGRRGARLPVLCAHGGPGMPHDYLDPLEAMTATGRQVVYYDQLGCGRTGLPRGQVPWSLALFVEELAAVREAAGFERVHLLGHGWGGMLAMEYALAEPDAVHSLVLASVPASMLQWRRETTRLLAALPRELKAALRAPEAAGTTADSSYHAAVDAYFRRHLCRMRPWPNCLERSLQAARACTAVHDALFGPGEFEPGGLLADWSAVGRVGAIRCPTLVVSGRYDRTTPTAAAALYQEIPASEWVVFEHSANMAHLEEPERYLEVLDGFLERAEQCPVPVA
jgi:L-proline amide hydrolase